MSDVLDEALQDFDQQLGVQEAQPEAAEEAGTSEQTDAEPAAAEAEERTEADRVRDEKGRFAKQEAEESAEELILGRFKTPEDLTKAYQELESEFGRRNQDWQELKQLREQLGDYQQQTAQQFEQQRVAFSAPQLIQQHIEQGNYRQAAEVAAQVPDQGLMYGQVLNMWRGEDPNAADMYQLVQDARWTQYEQQQQLSARAAQQTNEQAMSIFQKDKPDLQAVAPEMLKVAEESPKILTLLKDSDPQTRVEVLEYLYTKAKTRVTSSLTDAQRQAAEEQQRETSDAKKQAHVGSSSQRVEPDKKTPGEQWLEDIGFDEAAAPFYGRSTA